jgi:heat shock protein HtpX
VKRLKTVFFLSILTFFPIGLGFIINGGWGALLGFALVLIFLLGAYGLSDKMILYLYNAKELTEKEGPELYKMVKTLSRRGGVPIPNIYLINHPTPNALSTGKNARKGSLVLTTGLLALLDQNELSGIIGHELFHLQQKDIFISTTAALIAGGLTFFAGIAQTLVNMGHGGPRRENKPFGAFGAFFLVILAPLAAFFVRVPHCSSREFFADKCGARLCGNPLFLANALRKIQNGIAHFPMLGGPGPAHMFTVSPLSGKGFTHLFSTHPPIHARLLELEKMAQNRIYFWAINNGLSTQGKWKPQWNSNPALKVGSYS